MVINITQPSSSQVLRRYQVLRRIGKGGMGDVWLAEDPSLHRQVAIKTLPTHSQNDREFSLRFAREAQPKPNPVKWIPNVLGLAWSPNGRYIVGGYGRTPKICLWDLQNKTPTVKNGVQIQDAFIPASSSVGGQNGVAIDLAWSPDGRYLASASADKTVLIWKLDAS